MIPLRWGAALLWAAFILLLTSLPASDLAPIGAFSFPGADKLVHLGMYAVLGWLVARAPGAAPHRAALARMFVAILLFAAVDEWHQRFIPGRGPDALDLAADAAGAAAGLMFAAHSLRRRPRYT